MPRAIWQEIAFFFLAVVPLAGGEMERGNMPSGADWEKAFILALEAGDFPRARRWENMLVASEFYQPSARIFLLRHLLSLCQNRPDDALLTAVDEGQLAGGELAWYHAAASLAAERREWYVQSGALWQRARSEVASDDQLFDLEEFRLNTATQLQPITPSLEERLRAKYRSHGWREDGIAALKRYTLALQRLGRGREAGELLAAHRSHLPLESREAIHELLLWGTLLEGKDGSFSPGPLQQIVEEGSDEFHETLALQFLLLKTESAEARKELLNFLSIHRPSALGPGRSRSLRAEIQLAMALNDRPLVRDLALQLLLCHPPEELVRPLERLWLSLSLGDGATDFGEMAKMLHSIGGDHPSRSLAHSLILSLARHFFDGNDFSLAQRFLDELGEDILPTQEEEAWTLRIRLALASGKSDRALEWLQGNGNGISPHFYLEINGPFMESPLRFPWNQWLANFFNQNSYLLSPHFHHQFLTTLIANSLALHEWAAAQWFLQALGNCHPEAAQKDFSPDGDPWPTFFRMKLFAFGRNEIRGAIQREHLRTHWPDSELARESYFFWADFWEKSGKWADATNELENFVQIYGTCGAEKLDRIPEALLMLADLQAKRGMDGIRSAIGTLERLHRSYPRSPLARHARLMEGDLLRRSHEFSAAAAIYQSLLAQSPAGEESIFAELSLAQCHLALSSARPDGALSSLEKLSSLAVEDLNLRLEIDCTLIFALERLHEERRAQSFGRHCWQFYARTDENFQKLNAHGHFWLTMLGQTLMEFPDPGRDGQTANEISQFLLHLGNLRPRD
jgi:TolA-binding protein